MKRIIHYIVFVAAMLAVASCVEPLDSLTPIQDQSFSLSFSCGVMTKADGDRLATGNEDLIKQIDYFFFPLNEENAVDDDAEYLFHGTYIPSEHNHGGLELTYTETLDHSALVQIFPDGATKAMIFAVANYVNFYGANPRIDAPNTEIPEEVKTWGDLHELEVGPTFFKDGGPGFTLRWPRKMDPDDEALFFVMTGEEVIDLQTTDNEIDLKRLASKVTVNFTYQNYEEEKESGNIMWVPQPSGEETRVFMSNAIEHTTLGGPLSRNLIGDSSAGTTKPQGNGERDIFEYAYDFMNDITTTTSDGKKLAHYYTYPISMEEGDDNQPYIKLVLPWYGYKNYGTDQQILYKQKEVYYKIVIPSATVNEGNRIYEYNVTVNVIGSDKEVGITGDYIVKNWLTRSEISSNVATGRYISLDIPKNEYDMYVDLIDIAFVSSGKVIAHIDEIYQMDLSGSSPTPQYFMQNDQVVASTTLRNKKGIATDTAGDNVIKSWVTIPENTSYLRINHVMDNRQTVDGQPNSAFDMTPYVFKVTLHLEEAGDDTSFDRTVTITQYPSLYVTSKKSNGVVFVNGYSYANPAESSGSGANERHFAWNNRTNGNDSQRRIGSITNPANVTGSGTNNSQYNIIVHPTVLDQSLGLVIGDARESVGGSMTYISVTNYKAGLSGTDSRKVVSPGFLIASSYGKTTSVGFDRAKERCASYQENGYPAGRWRLPTEGEIAYLVALSNNGFVPNMFNGDYWASSQRYYDSTNSRFSPNNGTDTGEHAVRCVYDVWYWGEDPYQENATAWLGFKDN